MVKETIQIQLELLTAKFNNQMNKSRGQMATLNKTLLKQKEQYGAVNKEINTLSSNVSAFKKRTQAVTNSQRKQIATREREIALLKQNRTAMSNSMNATKQSQAVLNNQMKNRTRLFKKKEGEMKSNIKNTQQEAISTKLSAMQNLNWSGVARLNMDDYQMLAKSQKRLHSTSGRAMMGIRDLTHGMRGFRMEALGVMFFGMSMQRMFAGLLRPVMDAFGVFDIFRLMLLVLFLPIMKMLFPMFMKLMKWFLELSPTVKMIIGIFVVLGVIFGTILMIVGTLILGIGSLILIWPILASAASAAIAVIAAVFWPIVAIIAIIIAIVAGMRIAWTENFLGMKAIVEAFISGVKDFFSGIVMFFTGIFMIIKGIFLGEWSIIFDGLKLILVGFMKTVWGLFKIMVATIGVILVGILRIVWGIAKLLIVPFVWLVDAIVGEEGFVKKIVDGIVDWFKGLGDRLMPVISALATEIKDAMLKIIPDWMIDLFTGNFSIGGQSAPDSSKSVNDFIWRPGQGAVDINPNDTLVGFKGAPPNLSGSGGSNITNNFYGFTMEDLNRELDERDRNIVSQMEAGR